MKETRAILTALMHQHLSNATRRVLTAERKVHLAQQRLHDAAAELAFEQTACRDVKTLNDAIMAEVNRGGA